MTILNPSLFYIFSYITTEAKDRDVNYLLCCYATVAEPCESVSIDEVSSAVTLWYTVFSHPL